jgi:hypothetical protein
MKKISYKGLLFFALNALMCYSWAQGTYLPREDFSGAAYTLAVHEVNFEGVQNASKLRLPYSSVKGSPYLTESFLQADFYSPKGKMVGRQMARINLATQEIHFIGEKEQEFVAPSELSNKVVFHSPEKADTFALFLRFVPGLQLGAKPLTDYVQQLTFGEAVLYKHAKRYVASADSMFGTLKRYYFATTTSYFLKLDADPQYINKFSLSALLSILPQSEGMVAWSKSNKINIRKEEDLIALINHWNNSRR